MFKLDKKLEYSLVVLRHLHGCGHSERITARDICDKYRTPFDATSRVMQLMAQREWLKSERGVNGGYRLIAVLETISLFELMETVMGSLEIANCMNERLSGCQIECSCNILGSVKYLNDKLLDLYRSIGVIALIEASVDGDTAEFTSDGDGIDNMEVPQSPLKNNNLNAVAENHSSSVSVAE